MKDVIVIGGGASGLVAAIFAALNGNKVTILERNSTCGKKLLITGNGKCNYWNNDQDLVHYYTDSISTFKKIKNKKNNQELLDFLDSLGIVPKVKNNLFFPYSNQSISVLNALINKAKSLNVKIINNFYVTSITKEKYFIINNSIKAKNVIIAAGGMSYPKTGSDGSSYILAKELGHKINKPLPSLVKLEANESFLKDWNGVRCEAAISLYEKGRFIKQETGKLQLTDYGVSGICIFNLSHYVVKGLNKKYHEELFINFAPFLKNNFTNHLRKYPKLTICQVLEGFLNYKIVNIILKKCKINRKTIVKNLNFDQKELLNKYITSFPITITGYKSFDEAQVTTGGVSLKEIDENMQSKIIPNLYIIGEAVDVDGDCGGYNLGFAFVSGMLAGKNIKGVRNAENKRDKTWNK